MNSKSLIASRISNRTVTSNTLKNFLISSIPMIFHGIIEENKLKNRHTPSNFDVKTTPNISLQDYIYQLLKHTYAEVGTVIYALMLIDKLCTLKKFYLTKKNMHKTFFTALIVSIKLLEDVMYTGDQYVYASGVSAKEIALLEYEFITNLDYNLNIKDEDFQIYLERCIDACS